MMFEELTIFETAIADIEQRQEALRVRQHELQGRLEYWQSKVVNAVGTVAANVVKWSSKSGSFEKTLLPDLCRRINARWKYEHRSGHDAMTSIEFKEKYQWLMRINQQICVGELPLWLA